MSSRLTGRRIPVAGPWITDLEVQYVAEAARTAWYQDANVFQQRFEEAFAGYVGTKYAVALPSCTSAIHLALAALDVGPGDEVIVPDITWIASAAPIDYVGATVVFADIDPVTWCLSADSFEACITPRTRAVIPVDLYGGMPDMAAITEIARSKGIAVIEDAAEAVGALFKGRRAGSWGEIGVFSFHGSKTLTTGEGGMLVTDRDDVRGRVLVLRDHGRPPGDRLFWNHEVAFKYRMSSLQAALGLAQLTRIEELIARKREVFSWYHDALQDVPGIAQLNAEPAGTFNTFWMVTIVLDPDDRIEKRTLMDLLSDEGIDCRPFFHPLSSLPAYDGRQEAATARRRNQISYGLSPYGINLPSALSLDADQVHRVCEAVKAAIVEARRLRPGV
jgi:perosamine synthetase